jgi:hypothetical protein
LIVPYDDLVGWVAPIISCTDQCENVALEQHFDMPYSTAFKGPIKLDAEWTTIIDAESGRTADCEATLILIKTNKQYVVCVFAATQVQTAGRHLLYHCANLTRVRASGDRIQNVLFLQQDPKKVRTLTGGSGNL